MKKLFTAIKWLFPKVVCVLGLLSFSSAYAQLGINITAPTTGQTLAANANYTITVSTSGTASKVTYWIDNWTWIGESSTAPYSLTYNFPLTNGTHAIKARVTGTNNATVDATDRSFTIGTADNQTPTVPTGLSSAAVAQTSFTINWTASSDDVGVTGYDVYDGTTKLNSTNITATTYAVTGLTCGTSHNMTVRAKDAAGNVSGGSTALNVNTLACSGGGSSTTIPATIEAENYSAMSGIQTETTTDVGGGLNVGYMEPNDWMDYSINVPSAGTYTLNLRVASPNTGTQIAVRSGSTNLATVNVPNTGGWQTWQTITTSVNLSAGVQTIRLTNAGPATGYLWNLNWLQFSGGGGTGDTQAPTVPSNLTTSALTQTSVTVSWSASTDNVGVTGYDVYRNGSFLASTTSTSYSASGLACAATYSFYVLAKDAAGNQSANSSTVNATTSACSGGGSPSAMKLGTNFWNKGWGAGWVDYFQSGVNWSTTTNPWRADFLSELNIYKCLRFMDWVPTNNSNITSWSQRVPKTADQTTTDGVAYEWQIDLCNRLGADIWITIPAKANADYSYQLAQLLNSQLKPGLKIYLEYSNECWNGQFEQSQYCIDQGVALNLPGGNQYYKGWSYLVYASVRVFEQFERVFGQNSSRVIKVIAGQAGYTGANNTAPVCEQHLAALKDPTVNPNNTTFNSYAIAPYFGGDNFSDFAAAIPYQSGLCTNHLNSIAASGIPNINLIAYEGGQHNQTNADVNNRNPAMYQQYINYLNEMKTKISGIFCHYTHIGQFNSFNAWGAKEYAGQSLSEAHKYRALVDWVAANPPALSTVSTASILSQKTSGFEDAPVSALPYPNPFVSGVKLNLGNKLISNATVNVYELSESGKQVYTNSYSNTSGVVQLNLDNLKSGYYVLKLTTDTNVRTFKIIKK